MAGDGMTSYLKGPEGAAHVISTIMRCGHLSHRLLELRNFISRDSFGLLLAPTSLTNTDTERHKQHPEISAVRFAI